jgi:hypothetical protein
MTDPNLNSGSPVPTAFAVDKTCAAPIVARLSRLQALGAANDDAAASSHAIRNPLWIVVIGMACMFGVMALVTSLA